ncbi:MAG: sugar ABC transporter permease [Firmicutes bacterium]|nr:sugar ABC transporter permease [Bacillota bacterium]
MSKQLKKDLSAIPFILPFFIVYVIFVVYPMIQGVWMSLHRWTIVRKVRYIGLDNYRDMLQDPYFWAALRNTTYFVVLSTPTIIIAGLLLALISNQNLRGKTFFRLSFFMPNILSVAVISTIMVFVFRAYSGLISTLLKDIGIQQEIFWLGDPDLAWVVIVVATLWWTVGFNMVLFLAALQDIPAHLYEAASIDGASSRQMFWYITLPLLKPIIWVVTMLQIIASYKVFAQIWLITRGGPGAATRPIIQYIYEVGFRQNDLGYAATMSYALFLILMILTLVQMRVRRWGETEL